MIYGEKQQVLTSIIFHQWTPFCYKHDISIGGIFPHFLEQIKNYSKLIGNALRKTK